MPIPLATPPLVLAARPAAVNAATTHLLSNCVLRFVRGFSSVRLAEHSTAAAAAVGGGGGGVRCVAAGKCGDRTVASRSGREGTIWI